MRWYRRIFIASSVVALLIALVLGGYAYLSAGILVSESSEHLPPGTPEDLPQGILKDVPRGTSRDMLGDWRSLIPGTSAFLTYIDGLHGMAVFTVGTFDLPGGDQVSVRCWSPGFVARTKYFDIFLHYPESGGQPPLGNGDLQSVKIKTSDFIVAFDATKDTDGVWINRLPREQLRRISSAHDVLFDVGNGKTLSLHEDQLAQIRVLITYTDTQPLSPDDMETTQTKGQ